MNQKGFAPILIIILIATLIGGYLIYQNQNQPKLTPPPTIQLTPTPILVPESTNSAETANRKTYSDTRYNFSFQYSPGYDQYLKEYSWGIHMGCACEIFNWFDIEFIPTDQNSADWWNITGKQLFNGKLGINEKIYPKITESTVSSKIINKSNILMINAKISFNIPQKSLEQTSVSSKIYIFQAKGGLIVITEYHTNEIQAEEFNQILSTFKFLP